MQITQIPCSKERKADRVQCKMHTNLARAPQVGHKQRRRDEDADDVAHDRIDQSQRLVAVGLRIHIYEAEPMIVSFKCWF